MRKMVALVLFQLSHFIDLVCDLLTDFNSLIDFFYAFDVIQVVRSSSCIFCLCKVRGLERMLF